MKQLVLLILLISIFYISGSVLAEIQFEGNDLVTDEELQKSIVSYRGMIFDQETVLQDAKRISDFYQKLGFWNAKVYTPEVIPQQKDEVVITFHIDEGGFTKIYRLSYTGNTYLDSSYICRNTISVPENISDLSEYIEEIVSLYNEQGFYFAEIQVSSINVIPNGSVEVELKIDEGEYCRFTEAVVRGNEVTKAKTVLQLARLEDRENITPAELTQAEQKLLSRPYITASSIKPVSSSTLLYEIEEGSMTYLQALLGYDNNSGNDGRLLGYIDLDFDNLWGTDRSIGFYWEDRQGQHSSIELNYHESGWDLPLAGDLYLFREEMDSTWVEVSYSIEAYWYDLFMKTGLYFEKQDIYPGSRRPQIIEHTQFYKAGIILEHSDLDYSVNPRKGSSSNLKYYYIWSKDSNSESGRQAVESEYFRAHQLFGKWVTAINLNANVIENKNLTDFDIFYLGGSRSVRGFLEKQFSGYRTAWMNLEMRYLLSKDARMSLNLDAGYYENKKNGDDFIGSMGFGIRIPTPIGQFSLDFALPYQQKEFSGFMDSILHFGIETKL